MFTEKDLVAGETVLVWKDNPAHKRLYLGCAGLVHFISEDEAFKTAGDSYYMIEELNDFFTIEQPKSNAVPLEKKVYDFVPVRVRDSKDENWKIRELVLVFVSHDTEYPYVVINRDGGMNGFKQCEFLNEQ